jgi:hypothetical protein
MAKYFYASLTRISDLDRVPFGLEFRPRHDWQTGDYVAGEVITSMSVGLAPVELAGGRQVNVLDGDVVVGALGKRCATLEFVGDWREVGDDLRLELLTAAGVFGKCSDKSAFLPPPLPLRYRGHVIRGGKTCHMRDYVRPVPAARFTAPVVLIIGTSMDAGKTLTAKAAIRALKARGLRVGGAKFTGVGRYRDILAMSDAGADCIYDFVDAGLPSSCCPREEFEGSIDHLLAYLAAEGVDVVVAEAGASPLEPYNGDVVIERLKDLVRCTILCASDPYAVVGVMNAFGAKPDLIAGRATSTTAALDLLAKLCPVKALNLLNRASLPELDKLLTDHLGL